MHGAADPSGSHKVIMNPVKSEPNNFLPGKYLNQDYFVPYHMPHALS